MKNTLYLFILSTLITCTSSEKNPSSKKIENLNKNAMNYDIIDAYQLKINQVNLFGNYDEFIAEMGIPISVSIAKTEYRVHSKEEMDKIIAQAKNPQIVTLHYKGIDMWYTYDNSIIPFSIDFANTDKTVTYAEVNFNRQYSVEQFKKQFPTSGNPSFQLPQSFFGMQTGKSGSNYSHFIVTRKSKENPKANPLLEFTFEDGKLLFIFFVNF